MVEVRTAAATDAKSILDIYKPYILTTAFSFETEVPPVKNFEDRIKKCLQKFPWIVCCVNGIVAGYVYASSHREREAYQWTCESSVYIHDSFKGKGIGRDLYTCLFEILKLQGLRNVYAGITLPNDPSVQLHKHCGFEHFVVYKNIGYKFNSWHNVEWWRLQINDYDLQPPPPVKFSELDQSFLQSVFQKTAAKIRDRIIG